MTFLGLSMFLAFQLSIFSGPMPVDSIYSVPLESTASIRLEGNNIFFEGSSKFSFRSLDPINLMRLPTSYRFPLAPSSISYVLGLGVRTDSLTIGYRHTFSEPLCSSYDFVQFFNYDEVYLRIEVGGN